MTCRTAPPKIPPIPPARPPPLHSKRNYSLDSERERGGRRERDRVCVYVCVRAAAVCATVTD